MNQQRRILPQASNATPVRGLPAWTYFNAELTEMEYERLIRPSWQFVCHVNQLRKAGDFATLDMLRDSIIAIRGRDGVIRAFANACRHRNNNTFRKLLECVTLEGVRSHQAALQAIADANGGTRVSGTPGFDRSAAYAERVLRNAGYLVTRQEFQFQTFISLSPPILEQVSPPPAGPVVNNILSYSGSGDVTASVTALPGPAVDATPGCEAADFTGFTPGSIALMQRGTCTFRIKAENAKAAGALGSTPSDTPSSSKRSMMPG